MKNITIITSIELDKNKKDSIKKDLTKLIKTGDKFIFETDPQMLGGIKIMIGSKLLDGSLTHQIQAIKKQLTK